MENTIRPLAKGSYICAQCLSKYFRRLSTSRCLRNSSAPPPPLGTGFTELTNRGLVLLSGHDAPKFLQGLTTNNVDLSRDRTWYSGFLNAQGRVLWDALIYPYGGGERSYLIEVDKDEIEDFMRHLKRHKLRSKVTIRDAREEWRIWNVWQDGSFSSWQCRGSDEKKKRFIVASDPRHKALGSRILSRREDDVPSPISLNGESLQEAPLSAYIIRRYLHGIAEGQEEILRGSGLPMESNMDYLNGIDFRKGCYVGQELTIRTQHTGVIRKRILPVQLYNSSSSPPSLSYSPEETFDVKLGMDIKAEGGKRPAGRLLAGVGNVGLALCRLENMTDLRVSAEGGTWKEGTEFAAAAAENGDTVKVRAFVPEWLRLKEHEKMERRARREDPALE